MPEKRTGQWARAEEELGRSSALTQAVECAIRLLLGALLAGGGVFGGFAPFGVGFAACSGSGVEALCATAGAVMGYLLFQGMTEGLRFAAAAVLVFSVAFAFYDVSLYRKSWFMPLVAAGMDAATGFVYLSDSAWRGSQVALFAAEVVLAGVSTYFYRLALSPWRQGEDAPLSLRQKVSVLFLLGTLLMSLASVPLFGGMSLGRVLSAVLVLAVAKTGGLGYGAAAGVALGLGMDVHVGGVPLYTMAYGFAGFMTGAGWKQGRLYGAVAGAAANAVAVLWSWQAQPRMSALYEMFVATVVFVLLPGQWLRRLGMLMEREEDSAESTRRGLEQARQRLGEAARAFGRVGDSLRAAFGDVRINDDDPSTVFDRAAGRVCHKCVLRNTCWEKDYISTYNALNDAMPAMRERGQGEAGDFPGWFTGRCLQFPAFLHAVNQELTAQRYRRQYQTRLRENRGAVCGQYETLAQVLDQVSAELSDDLTPDVVRQQRLHRHLTALGLEGETAAWYDRQGRLRLEAEGDGVKALERPEQLRQLSRLMGVPLRLSGEAGEGRVALVQAETLMAVAGVAARRREGQSESGDAGTWFKREDGSLFVLLCDGMGSGEAAQRESALAVRLLEGFLRSGMDSARAMGTVNSALALRNDETGAFTTVDLLRLDLYTGQGELCKLGAAPSYLRRKGTVSRISGAALPAGLAGGGKCDVTALTLAAGDCVVLVSDGICDVEDDGWVRQAVERFDGQSPKELARALMEESEKRVGPADDRTVMVITLKKREKQGR